MAETTMPRSMPMNPHWFASAVGAMVILCRSGGMCASGMLAERLGAHAVFVRRILAQLVRAGLVTAREGRVGGYQLAHPPEDITLGAIYRALQPECAEAQASTTAQGMVSEPSVQRTLGTIYQQTEEFLLATLDAHTLADITQAAQDDGDGCASATAETAFPRC